MAWPGQGAGHDAGHAGGIEEIMSTPTPSQLTPPAPPARVRPARWLTNRVRRTMADDAGAATAEFAVVTMAAVGFAGLLVVILRSDEVRTILTDLVRNALSVGF